MAKIIAAVRIQRIFRAIFFHLPDNVEDMKALLRGVAFEADNAALVSASNYAFDSAGSIGDNEYTYSMYVDRRYLNSAQVKRVPGYGASYETIPKSNYRGQEGRVTPSKNNLPERKGTGKRQQERGRARRSARFLLKDGMVIEPNQCIVCSNFGCHSSKHRKASEAFVAAMNDPSSDSDKNETGSVNGASEAELGTKQISNRKFILALCPMLKCALHLTYHLLQPQA